MTKNQNWYILYTLPRFEKRVKDQLEGGGVDCFLPLHRCPRVWSDRVKMVDLPLFNSYIFVRCREYEVMPLIHVNGVVKVVFYNGRPAIVRQSEIDAIRQFIEEAKEKTLCTGDEVQILTGLMKKRFGKIIRIKKKYIMLHVEQLAATVCVNIESIVPLKKIEK